MKSSPFLYGVRFQDTQELQKDVALKKVPYSTVTLFARFLG
jgi:hypothetical protein